MLKLKRDYRVLKDMPICIDLSKENILEEEIKEDNKEE